MAQDMATVRAESQLDISRQRLDLLAAVAGVRDDLVAGGPLAEKAGTLPQLSVDAISRSRAFHLKLPHCLGGIEADLITQMQLAVVDLLRQSAGFSGLIRDRRLGLEVAVIHRLAVSLNQRLRSGDPLAGGVHHGKLETLGLTLGAVAGSLFGRAR